MSLTVKKLAMSHLVSLNKNAYIRALSPWTNGTSRCSFSVGAGQTGSGDSSDTSGASCWTIKLKFFIFYFCISTVCENVCENRLGKRIACLAIYQVVDAWYVFLSIELIMNAYLNCTKKEKKGNTHGEGLLRSELRHCPKTLSTARSLTLLSAIQLLWDHWDARYWPHFMLLC